MRPYREVRRAFLRAEREYRLAHPDDFAGVWPRMVQRAQRRAYLRALRTVYWLSPEWKETLSPVYRAESRASDWKVVNQKGGV